MTTFRQYWFYLVLVCLTGTKAFSQNYQLFINLVDKDTSLSVSTPRQLNLKNSFISREESTLYINKLPALLLSKGYPAASVDTVIYDTTYVTISLYLGHQYQWANINTDSIEKKLLDIAGWKNNRMNFTELRDKQQKMLEYYESNGYPFASIKLDNITFDGDNISARLTADKGLYYVIDSIRVFGKIKIKNIFLQRYLDIENGSAYDRNKLEAISKKLMQLPYLQELQHWDLNMLGNGSVLNLYLQPKRSSQVNFLVGFLPSNNITGKLQVTADVNLNLKNSLGSGETILLNWQQLQKQSPRLNLGYQHPYIFKSRFGIDLGFDLLKRDSTFLQINGQLGLLYVLSSSRSAKIFFQTQRSYLLSGGFDTNQLKITKRLPANIDVSANSLGLNYEWINTNYIFNPRKGNELKLTTSFGLKRISKNNEIANLKDPFDPSYNFNVLYDTLKLKTYQFTILMNAAHYFPAGKKSTLKTGLNAALFQSEDIFRNELFRIGGYKILRGFNEESIYATQYAILTAEYRYLTGLNSFLFLFTDAAVTRSRYQYTDIKNSFFSTGLGLSVETGFGILNVSYAIGKRNDVKFDLRGASKIHFGYINYF